MQRRWTVLAFVVAGISSGASAHSLDDLRATSLTPPLKAEFAAQQELADKLGLVQTISVRGVIEKFMTWPTDRPVRACFYNGSKDLRAFFIATASEWTANTALNVDFGPEPNFRTCGESGDIRIKFTDDPVSWSYVGTGAKSYPDGETVNINNTSVPPMGSLARDHLTHTILHEFGHALGLEHEHQNPLAHCDEEFNWDALYKAYVRPGVTAKMVHDNVAPLADPENLGEEAYDPKSIMNYVFPAAVLTKGEQSRCFTREVYALSDGDHSIVQKYYPVAIASEEQRMQSVADDVSGKLASLRLDADQQSVVATEIGKTLKQRNRKVADLRFNLGVVTRGMVKTYNSRDANVKDCKTHGATPSGITCKVAADGSGFSLSVQP